MKTFFLFVAACFCMVPVFSQNSNVHFGVKAGLNAAHFKIEPEFNSDARISFNAGVLSHIHISPHFALQPELMISGQGANYPNDRKDKFTYLNIPLLAQVMFGDGFRVQTGPQAGILLRGRAKNGNRETGISDNFKSFDASWSFGGGYLSHSGLGVDIRYNLGLSNISKIESVKVKNRVWQFGLFYQWK